MLLRVRARVCPRVCFIPVVCLLAHTHSPIRSRTHTFSLTRKHIQTRAGRAARIPGVAWRKGHYWGSRSHWAYGWSGATWYAWSAGPAWRAGVYVLPCVVVWYSMVQCVAVCCSVLQCVAVCCSVLQWCRRVTWYACRQGPHGTLVRGCCSLLQSVAVCCSVSKWCRWVAGYASLARPAWCAGGVCVAGGDSSCVFGAMCCSVLQCVAVCCSVLQCVAVCCGLAAIGGDSYLAEILDVIWREIDDAYLAGIGGNR